MKLNWKSSGSVFVILFVLCVFHNAAAFGGLFSDFEKNPWNCVHLIDFHNEKNSGTGIWANEALELLKEQVLAGAYQKTSVEEILNIKQSSRFVARIIEKYEESKREWSRTWKEKFEASSEFREKYLMDCYVRAAKKTRRFIDNEQNLSKRSFLNDHSHKKEEPFDGP